MENESRDDEEYSEGRITREELAERRRRNQERKEFESDIDRDLRLKYEKVINEDRKGKYRNKYLDTAIIFFNTLALLYVLLFVLKFVVLLLFEKLMSVFGIYTGWINPALHLIAWTGAVVSSIRKRSVLDDLLNFFY